MKAVLHGGALDGEEIDIPYGHDQLIFPRRRTLQPLWSGSNKILSADPVQDRMRYRRGGLTDDGTGVVYHFEKMER